MSNHYSDFELTLDNCHREPIHRPEWVEGTGHLLAFGDDEDGALLAISDGAAQAFGCEEKELDEQGLTALPQESRAQIQALQEGGVNMNVTAGSINAKGKNRSVICHRHNGVLFLEQELGDTIVVSPDQKSRYLETLRVITDLDALFQLGAEFFRDCFGFDRVMVYQFDTDNHGFVVGEAKRDDLEPFLGLHYPATDIPKPARDIFLLTRSRAIPDIELANRAVRFTPRQQGHLDLSRCQLRAASAIHIEYLMNMGVRATMTIAIIVHGKLWGLFALHHYSAINPQFTARLDAEMLSSSFAQRLLEIEQADLEQAEHTSRATAAGFLDELRIEDQFQLRVMRAQAPLQALCPSDGAAVVSASNVAFKSGTTPSNEALLALRDWLVTSEAGNLFSTDDIVSETSEGALLDEYRGGVLAIRVSEITETFVLWFRAPQRQQIRWAGDPRAPQMVSSVSPEGKTRVSPRQSFAKWEQEVIDRSPPWEAWTLRMAEQLRQSILKLELKHNAALVKRANDEFMQLTFAASHDLQEPLRTQLNYLEILQEELEELGNDEFNMYIEGATRAIVRMRDLVGDMLEYAQLGRDAEWEEVDLDQLLQNIHTDYADALARTSGELTWSDMPIMSGDPRHLRSILQNLINNAIKYVDDGVKPQVDVSIRHHKRAFELCVADNGIGIEPEHHERIFTMFARLHDRNRFKGTGIGLAITKRAVSILGGTISVESKLGGGSVFRCRFHEAQLVK
ncbi:MAG: ATP-binding protein [Gammaproteobacteria bacterium]